jgi:hypothetical protein
MENLPEDIKKKLGKGDWRFDQLPLRDDGTSWSDVQKDCDLLNSELSELKNARCPGKHRVSIALFTLKSLYISHLISPTRLLLSVK